MKGLGLPERGARFLLMRRTLLRQVDLFLVLWSAAFLALAAYGSGRAGIRGEFMDALLERPVFALILFAVGAVVALTLRLWLRWRDFVLVTDYRNYFFAAAGTQIVLCRRVKLRSFREDLDGILLDSEEGQARVAGPAELLVTIHNILMVWRNLEGRPADPAHSPPWTLNRR